MRFGTACAEGLQIAEAIAQPSSLMWASHGIGLLSLRQGDLSRALAWLERAVGLCQDADLSAYAPRMAAALGAAYAMAGRTAEAMSLLTRALSQSVAGDRVGYQVLCCLALGESERLAGRLEEAHTHADGALALARKHHEQGHEAYTRHLLGEIAAHHDLPQSTLAEAHYQQALTLAEALGMQPLVAHCHLSLGRLALRLAQRERARLELTTATNLYRAMEMRFWLSQAEAVRVEGSAS